MLLLNRRSFVRGAGSATLALPGMYELAQAHTDTPGLSTPDLDQSVIDFWTKDIDKPYRLFKSGVQVQTKGAPSWQPSFVSWNSTKSEFHDAENIEPTILPKSGDMNVSLRVMRFHPSSATAASIGNVKSGSLRVDLKQTEPLPALTEVLAWSAVAGLVPKSASLLPDLKNLTFDSGQNWSELQNIPLTNGLGFWNLNFFLTPKDSTWAQFMSIFRKADAVVFPLLGLPAIAVAALTAVDKLFAYLQARDKSEWLFRSQDSPICATQEALQTVGSGLPVTTGEYLVIPQEQLHKFGQKASNLKLANGFLVSKASGEFDYLQDEVQDIDYISVHIRVTPATSTTKKA